jgi:hypothetical protein
MKMDERRIHTEMPAEPAKENNELPSAQVAANPNPRANENLDNPGHEQATEGGVGSEITDGEDA